MHIDTQTRVPRGMSYQICSHKLFCHGLLAGNEAAHDVGVNVSQEDARDMLDFSNAILDYLSASSKPTPNPICP